MIRKVIIRNIKKFGQQEFEIPNHLVIAGQNNSGKTTVLQAIAAWSEIAFKWLQDNRDLLREQDGNYPGINLNILNFYSIPLVDFDHLWRDKDVKHPASIWLHTDRWKIGFEILYKERELVFSRPAKDVKEDDLEKYIESPLIPVYIPPSSQLELNEVLLNPEVVRAQLAGGRGGSVLRNLLVAVNQDTQKWEKLKEVVKSFFGYELSSPSSGAKILARYQHSKQEQLYELSSAASGFLQVLMVYASLLHKDVSVVLIDEPDAHLHILLQEKIYRDLRKYVRLNKLQLIIATHSEQIIDTADVEVLHTLTSAGELRRIGNRDDIKKILRLVENTEITLAHTEPGILYVEGKTDIDILREWARILEHPLLDFLEKPFFRRTAEEKGKNGFPMNHYDAMRLVVPGFRGVELRDGDQDSRSHPLPGGMLSLRWTRPDIESYLIHPHAIMRFVEKNKGIDAAHMVDDYMKNQLPPALYKTPCETYDFALKDKGKTVLSRFMQEAGMDIEQRDYYQIAAEMKEDEIHPEVRDKLDAIVGHFNIQS